MKKLKIGTLSFIAAAFLIGCGGGSSSSSTSSVSGKVVDGPIYNAKVCVDYNFNGQCDAGEPTATTDINGTYQLKNVNLNALAPLIVVPQANTIDTFTNKPFKRKLSAPLDGSKVNISPITTIVGAQLYALKQNNDLNPQTVDQLKESIAKSLGINSDITKVDPLEDPKLAALSVTLSEVCPDVNQNFDDLEEEIDVQKLKEGNLTAAIKNDTVKQVLQNIVENQNLDELKDPKLIQIVVQNAITNDDPDVLKQNPDQLKQIALKDILTSNVFFKQDDDGYYIQFNTDNTVADFETDENDTPVKLEGNWNILDNGEVEIDYSNGSKATFRVEQENAYIYKVQGIDSDGNKFEDTALALPKDYFQDGKIVNIQNLPGITPLKENEFVGKALKVDNSDYVTFNSDGTAVENDGSRTAKYTWKLENGVMVITGNDIDSGNPFTAYMTRFDDYLFLFINKNNQPAEGWIFKTSDLVKQSVNNSNNTVKFTKDLVANKTMADVVDKGDNPVFTVFLSDGTYKEYENGKVNDTGNWEIDNNGNLIVKSNDGEEYKFVLLENLGGIVYKIKSENSDTYNYFAVLNTTNPFIKVNSSNDLKNISGIIGRNKFKSDMIADKTFHSFRYDVDVTFNNDNTFNQDDGESGTWSIDSNGVLVLKYDNSNDTTYIALGEVDNNQYKVLEFSTDNGTLQQVTPDVLNINNSATSTNNTNGVTDIQSFLNYIKENDGITEADIASLTSEDISGKTFAGDEDNNETITYNSDGTFKDTFTDDDGTTYTFTGKWSVSDNVLTMNLDKPVFDIKTIYKVKLKNFGNNFYELDVDGNGKIVDDEFPKKVDFINGKITFKDSDGNTLTVPDNAKIKITPQQYQNDEDGWTGVSCLINSDGTFGNNCYYFEEDTDITPDKLKEAIQNQTNQIAVYNDENNDYQWEANETAYDVEENVTISDLNNIDLNVTINNN